MENLLLCGSCVLVHIPTLLLRLLPFREVMTARQKKKLLWVYGVSLVLNFFLLLAVCARGEMTIGLYKLNLLQFCVVMGAVNIFLVPGFWREHLFSFGLTAMIFWQVFAVAAFLVGRIGYDSISRGILFTNGIGLILFFLLYPWSRRLVQQTITPFLVSQNESYWNTTWFIPISMFLSGIFSRGYQGYTDSILDLISLLLVGVAAYLICCGIARDYRTLQEKDRLDRQVKLQKQYYDALTAAVEKERQARHDFKHQLAAIRAFLDTGDTQALRDYCNSLEIDRADIAQIPHTGNPAADGVLYYYACEAKKQKITYRVRCRLDGLGIGDTDLCCLLGNALDNAVTACGSFDGPREITVASEKRDGVLVLTVDNSFDGVLFWEKGVLLSRKRTHSPGIGIASMEEICKKYQGTSRFEGNGTRFEASFLLRLPEKTNE